jgi:uncharacterized protein (TIGR03118 family)
MRSWFSSVAQDGRRIPCRRRRRASVRLGLELLERREVLSTAILQTNLVSDISGLAQVTDKNLVNPWGLAAGPGGPLWVADNGTGLSTLYNGAGAPQALVVTIPPPKGSPPGTRSTPTGTVFNGAGDFKVSANGKTGSSIFLFDTEDGTISGWNPGVAGTNAILAVDNSTTGAVYKGLAIGTDSNGRHLLYAANFRSGAIDVFDNTFASTTVSGGFVDKSIPAGYAPFNIQLIGDKLYVAYAKQNASKHDPVFGAGNGFVDVFTTDGKLVEQLAAGGPLNAPWGVEQATSNFGDFSGDILVGNFGDGHINAFKPSGQLVGQLTDVAGNPITVGGLWALRFGGGGQGGDPNTLFFTAGINRGADGLLGTFQVASPAQADTFGDDNAFLQTNLVSDVAGVAQHTDPNLKNPWGLVAGPNTPFWVSDNRTNVSTLYNGQGVPQSLVVAIPSVNGGPSRPTGVVFNGDGNFVVSQNGVSGSSAFIFATQQGTIAGWNPQVNLNNAVIAVDNSATGANYTGLALVNVNGQQLLYAANSKGGIDVFDAYFNSINLGDGAFQDPNPIPGYTPYNIQDIDGQLFVTYSKGPGGQAGDGYINVFNTDGTYVQRFTTGGPLDEPWGMAVAPAGFGHFGGDLLVGNVGNGHIDAFNMVTGAYVGTLLDGRGTPIAINGLWGLSFGNGTRAGDPNTLFFTAGIGGYQHGLFGELQAIEPIAVGGQATVLPQNVVFQGLTTAALVSDQVQIIFQEIQDGNLDKGLVQQVLTELSTAQKSVAPFSTPLAQLFTQTAADLQTLVTGLSNPNNLETNERHLTADIETLDSVFADLSVNPFI